MISLELVADDEAALPVPQDRHGGAAGVGGVGLGVELMDAGDAVDAVGHHALARREGPAILRHQPVRHREADHALKALERAIDQRAAGPGTGEGDVEVIASRLGLEAALTAWPRRPIGGDPIAELRIRAHEAAARALGVVPLVLPDPVDEKAHDACPRLLLSLLSAIQLDEQRSRERCMATIARRLNQELDSAKHARIGGVEMVPPPERFPGVLFDQQAMCALKPRPSTGTPTVARGIELNVTAVFPASRVRT